MNSQECRPDARANRAEKIRIPKVLAGEAKAINLVESPTTADADNRDGSPVIIDQNLKAGNGVQPPQLMAADHAG